MATAIGDGIALESERMQRVLAAQKDGFTAAMPESLAVRGDRIDRAIALLVDHAEDFAKAVSEDFGHRSREQPRSDEHTSALQSLMRISYAVFCLKTTTKTP